MERYGRAKTNSNSANKFVKIRKSGIAEKHRVSNNGSVSDQQCVTCGDDIGRGGGGSIKRGGDRIRIIKKVKKRYEDLLNT